MHCSVNYYRHDETGEGGGGDSTDPRSERGDSCSLFHLQLLRASVLIVRVGASVLPLPQPPSSPSLFILLFSHRLFFCPRLNSLTHTSESSTPLPNKVAMVITELSLNCFLGGWEGGLYVTVPEANMLPAGQRSEARTATCPLCTNTWGKGLILSFLCIIQSLPTPTTQFVHCGINELIFLYICMLAVGAQSIGGAAVGSRPAVLLSRAQSSHHIYHKAPGKKGFTSAVFYYINRRTKIKGNFIKTDMKSGLVFEKTE